MSVSPLPIDSRPRPKNEAPRPGTGEPWKNAPVPPRDATTGVQGGLGPATTAPPARAAPGATPRDAPAGGKVADTPFQRLAPGIQAILIQAQGKGTSPTTGTSPAAGTGQTAAAAADPEQKLATDIRALMTQLGGASGAAKMPGGRGGGAEGQVHRGHQHTGHGGGPTSASSVATASSAAGGAGSGAGRTVATMLAGDIAKAIRAYGAGVAGAAGSAGSATRTSPRALGMATAVP